MLNLLRYLIQHLESPLGQVSMIPLLAWIAKNAPSHLKATFLQSLLLLQI